MSITDLELSPAETALCPDFRENELCAGLPAKH